MTTVNRHYSCINTRWQTPHPAPGSWLWPGLNSSSVKGQPVLIYHKIKRFIAIPLLVSGGLVFAACGSGNEGGGGGSAGSVASQPAAALLAGQFLDSATQGLAYETDSQSGVETDANGQFLYRSGETIQFRLGGLLLGTTTAKPVITPMDLVSGGHVNHQEVVNLTRFLQTLDDDGNPENGITISAQTQQLAETHFPPGGEGPEFFKSGVANGGFIATGSASPRLTAFLKDTGLGDGLLPRELATNHLLGTLRGQPESWTLELTPTSTGSALAAATGSASLTLSHATKVNKTEGQIIYHDPAEMPTASGQLLLSGLTVPLPATVTAVADATGVVTSAKASLTLPFSGATVSMKKLGSGAKGRLTIAKLAGGTADKASIALTDASLGSLATPTSGYTTLVMQATVDTTTGALSDATFSVRFSETTWSGDLGLGTVSGSWKLGASSGGALFREMYRSLAAPATPPVAWALYGIRKGNAESSAELTGSSYALPGTSTRNLVRLDSGSGAVETTYPMNGYVGFSLYIFDSSIQIDQVLLAGTALAAKGKLPIPTVAAGDVLPNIGFLDMKSTKDDPQVALASKTDGLTWYRDAAAVGPGTFAAVFTNTLIADGSGFSFKTLDAADQLSLVLVKAAL